MAIAPRIRRRLGVALAAIAAALPSTARASGESRCEMMPAGCTASSCCEGASPESPRAGPLSASMVAPATTSRGIIGRPVSCVCRIQEPTAPAQKPGPSEKERRLETGCDVAADSPSRPGLRAPVAIAFMPDVGPPRSPIYLRTSRLLI